MGDVFIKFIDKIHITFSQTSPFSPPPPHTPLHASLCQKYGIVLTTTLINETAFVSMQLSLARHKDYHKSINLSKINFTMVNLKH